MSSETCANCRFWKRYDLHEEPNLGGCLRFPPVYVGEEPYDCDKAYAWWQPTTDQEGHCGEFQPIEQKDNT